MAQHDSALSEPACRPAEVDGTHASSIGEILGAVLQAMIEAELTARIGAEPVERSSARTVQRNGHRPKLLSTPAGDVEVEIPKLRKGSFFPELLDPRRTDRRRASSRRGDRPRRRSEQHGYPPDDRRAAPARPQGLLPLRDAPRELRSHRRDLGVRTPPAQQPVSGRAVRLRPGPLMGAITRAAPCGIVGRRSPPRTRGRAGGDVAAPPADRPTPVPSGPRGRHRVRHRRVRCGPS